MFTQNFSMRDVWIFMIKEQFHEIVSNANRKNFYMNTYFFRNVMFRVISRFVRINRNKRIASFREREREIKAILKKNVKKKDLVCLRWVVECRCDENRGPKIVSIMRKFDHANFRRFFTIVWFCHLINENVAEMLSLKSLKIN